MKQREFIEKDIEVLRARTLLLLLVMLAGFLIILVILPQTAVNAPSVSPPTAYVRNGAVPQALASLIGFGRVKPYNVTSQSAAGATVYAVSFDTQHLSQNYTLLKDAMTRNNGFSLDKDVNASSGFILEFHKGTDRLIASATPVNVGADAGAVTVSLHRVQ